MQLTENLLLFKPPSLQVCAFFSLPWERGQGEEYPEEKLYQDGGGREENHFYFSKAVAPKPFPVLILPPIAHFCGHAQGEMTSGPFSLNVEMMKWHLL